MSLLLSKSYAEKKYDLLKLTCRHFGKEISKLMCLVSSVNIVENNLLFKNVDFNNLMLFCN